jgi:hypothetical protein
MATLVGVLPEVGGVDREDEEGAEAASEEDVEGAEGSKGVLELELGVNYKSEAQYGRQCLLPFSCVLGQSHCRMLQPSGKRVRKARRRARHKAVHLSQLALELRSCFDFSRRHNTAIVLDKSSR